MSWSITLSGHTTDPEVEKQVAEQVQTCIDSLVELTPVADRMVTQFSGEGSVGQIASGAGAMSPGQAAALAEPTEPASAEDRNPVEEAPKGATPSTAKSSNK